MNYKISFSEMNRLAMEAQSKKPKLSLAEMRKQASILKNGILSKVQRQKSS